MKTYSLASVPTCAGLYYLTNKRTGEIYVGQSNGLRRRHIEWKNAFTSGFGRTNAVMHAAVMRSPDLDEWFFVVAAEMPGATTEELLAAEAQEIIKLAKSKPEKILNTQIGKDMPSPLPENTVILTDEGVVIGQAAAARMLGRNVDTIRDKVRWLRDQGVRQVRMSDLTMDRRKVLQKIKNTQGDNVTS